ncbi:MAG: hypothetical protein DMG14_31995 [Acidobacteria bacterium]|nr:MAG: hypothetical protein DMG14_31995 [Acidobacteriota bacterium]
MSLLPEPVIDPLVSPPGRFNAVKPQEFDPGRTNLVQAAWLNAIGCPTGASIAIPNSSFTGVAGFAPFTDTACATGDPNDQHNEGLLLVKTGPTENFASATAELINVKGITLTELGYDIRKLGATANLPGSHCGAGAPRFNVITDDGVLHFLGCNSPPPAQVFSATGWIRLRWSPASAFPPILTTVRRIVIVFDEGQDPSGGPDQFGAAILDNIDVNGQMVGHGATDAS